MQINIVMLDSTVQFSIQVNSQYIYILLESYTLYTLNCAALFSGIYILNKCPYSLHARAFNSGDQLETYMYRTLLMVVYYFP